MMGGDDDAVGLLERRFAAIASLRNGCKTCQCDSADVLQRLDYGPCGTDRSLASSATATQRLHTVHAACAWQRLRSDYVTVT
ncbi:hypothetical protein EMIT048CA2_120003 [Pseudomonas chlororaphis]